MGKCELQPSKEATVLPLTADPAVLLSAETGVTYLIFLKKFLSPHIDSSVEESKM